MLLAVVLLYVGAVLGVNGIWLIGQARAAAAEPAPAAVGEGAGGGDPAGHAPSAAERSPLFLQGREVAVINIFTGFVGVVIALILLIQAAVQSNLASARGGWLHPAVRLHLPVGGVQPVHQRQWPGVRLVLPVRGDHGDPGRDLHPADRRREPRRRVAGAQLVRLGHSVGAVLRAVGAGTADRTARRVGDDHRGHRHLVGAGASWC